MSEFGRRRTTFSLKGRPRSMVVVPARFRRRRRQGRRTRRNPRSGGFLGMELKFYDTTLVDSNLATTSTGSGIEKDPSATIVLNSVVQGDGESQRDGRKISMKSIFISGIITIPAVADQTVPEEQPHIAIWLVLDMQTNGATIVSENVFVNKGADVILGTSLMRNLQFTSRFRILDKVAFNMVMPGFSGSDTNYDLHGSVRKFKLSAKLNGMGVLYSGTTETVANITNNSLHILAVASSITMAPNISYNSRLRFMG